MPVARSLMKFPQLNETGGWRNWRLRTDRDLMCSRDLDTFGGSRPVVSLTTITLAWVSLESPLEESVAPPRGVVYLASAGLSS